jgi:metal iron transporter
MVKLTPQPAVRRIVTRLIGVVPAAAVAAALGETGLNTMLVASQVVLSIILPTVIFPLVLLCSKEDLMTVEGLEVSNPIRQPTPPVSRSISAHDEIIPAPAQTDAHGDTPEHVEQPTRQTKSYKSPLWITILGYLLFSVVVIANGYVIVQLGLGN